jgi:hypothetical protein
MQEVLLQLIRSIFRYRHALHKGCISKVSAAVSYFSVSMIGTSLGLISVACVPELCSLVDVICLNVAGEQPFQFTVQFSVQCTNGLTFRIE